MEDSEEEMPKSRRSGRSTKFKASLREPSDSVQDLIGPSSKSKKKRQSKGKGDEDDDMDEDDDLGEDMGSPSKTKARRHASNRRRVKTEVLMSASDEEESEEEGDEHDEDEEELKVQRIIAIRSEKRRDWKKICDKINTSEIEFGSRWFQETGEESESELDTFEERFLVKWPDLSFLHCSWETEADLIEQIEGVKTAVTTFFRKSHNGCLYTADERCDGDYFDPAFVQIERIVEVFDKNGTPTLAGVAKDEKDDHDMIFDRKDKKYEEGTGRQFLVRWMNTPYSEMTYEFERDLIVNEVEYEDQLDAFFKRCQKVRVKFD